MSDDPLMDEDLILDPRYNFTPIRALRPSCRAKMGQFLDLEGTMVVIGEYDYVNNFNGLAELIGFGYIDIRNFANKRSPTQELLHQWTTTEQGQQATIGNLWSHLFQLERFDVLKDCRKTILNDCRVYEEHAIYEREAERYRIEKQMEQDPRVTNSDMKVDETRYVTVQDINSPTGEMTIYDAFICYEMENEEDRQFVRKLIQKLEVEPESSRKLQLFVPGRDDLPGSAAHTINAYLIEKRCRRMIIVMSKAFHNSQACDFQTKFAHCLAPGARSKRLIPVIKDKGVPLPRILRFLAVCDFTKSDMEDWVWERLYTAVVAPMPLTIDPEYADGESSHIDDLMNLPFPVSKCIRLNDPDGASNRSIASGDSGMVVERNSASSSNSSEPMQVVHQLPEQSGKSAKQQTRELVKGQDGEPTPASLLHSEDKQAKKKSKSPSRFASIFKKKKQEKPTKSTTDNTQNDGPHSEVMVRNVNVPFGATRDQLSMIVNPTKPEDSDCRQKTNERVEIDIQNQSASHKIDQVDSVCPKREPMETPDSLRDRREPVQHLDVERRDDSVKPILSGKEEKGEHVVKPNRDSSDSNEVTSTSSIIYL